jgi:hypothetical protein
VLVPVVMVPVVMMGPLVMVPLGLGLTTLSQWLCRVAVRPFTRSSMQQLQVLHLQRKQVHTQVPITLKVLVQVLVGLKSDCTTVRLMAATLPKNSAQCNY